ncbi:MAG: rod shape-determining protein MreD [Bacteroidia bacterium]
MTTEWIKNIFRGLLMVFLQISLFNHIAFLGLHNPFVYVFFILMLPLSTPRSLLMLAAFASGLLVDVFSNTGGMHAMASTLIAFLRPAWIRVSIPRSNFDDLQNIKIREIEFLQFLAYSSLLIVVHHIFLFSIASFDWSEIWLILWKSLVGSLLSLICVLAFRYFDLSPRKKS